MHTTGEHQFVKLRVWERADTAVVQQWGAVFTVVPGSNGAGAFGAGFGLCGWHTDLNHQVIVVRLSGIVLANFLGTDGHYIKQQCSVSSAKFYAGFPTWVFPTSGSALTERRETLFTKLA